MMVLEGAIEAARGALVRRGAERVTEAVFDEVSARMSGPGRLAQAPSSFSVGATAFIAATSAVIGGLAGWALHDLIVHKGKRS